MCVCIDWNIGGHLRGADRVGSERAVVSRKGMYIIDMTAKGGSPGWWRQDKG